MLIPYSALSHEALRGLISQFILSHADEHADALDNEANAALVMAALKRGELVISFSELEETAAIRPREEVPAGDTLSSS